VGFNFVPKEESARKRKNFLDTSRNRFSYNLKYPSVILKETIQLVSFIRLQLPIISNKPILEQNDPFRKTLNRLLFLKEFLLKITNSYRGLVRISPNADNARNFRNVTRY
jgi:hypothetical protein